MRAQRRTLPDGARLVSLSWLLDVPSHVRTVLVAPDVVVQQKRHSLWVAADGGVFAFGDARFQGSGAGIDLNKPVVAIAATPGGQGYWLVAADGGVFTFGDARFYGSTGSQPTTSNTIGMVATVDGKGYGLITASETVTKYGDSQA
jgi:hypothetical protein